MIHPDRPNHRISTPLDDLESPKRQPGCGKLLIFKVVPLDGPGSSNIKYPWYIPSYRCCFSLLMLMFEGRLSDVSI